MADFVALTTSADADTAETSIYDALADAFPGWEPSDAQLETRLSQPVARLWAAVMALDAVVGEEVFRGFGSIVGVPPISESPATATATVTAIDNAGYTVPAGTQFSIAASGSESYGFTVASDVLIPAGSTTSTAGAMTLVAIEPGTAANGLTANPTPVDALAFISTVVLTGATSGGVDEEDPSAYLDRLRGELRLLAPTPILTSDFAVLALTIPGVARALGVDGYNPGDATYNNERMVAVAVVDEDGAALSGGVKTQVDDLLEALREVNFVVNVIDPTPTVMSVTTTVKALPGHDLATVQAAVTAALTDYFAPANWGRPVSSGDPSTDGGWVNQSTVRYLEVTQVVNNVPGVDYISSLTFKKAGGSLATSDVSLTGAAPLTTTVGGTLSVTAT